MNTHYFRLTQIKYCFSEDHCLNGKFDLEYIGTNEFNNEYDLYSIDSVWSNADLGMDSEEINYKIYLDEQIQQYDQVICMTDLGENESVEILGRELSYDEQIAERDELIKESDKIQAKWTELANIIGPHTSVEQIHIIEQSPS